MYAFERCEYCWLDVLFSLGFESKLWGDVNCWPMTFCSLPVWNVSLMGDGNGFAEEVLLSLGGG